MFLSDSLSHQLLDCFVIPVLMILSWWVLKTRYRPVHFVAVCICLLGVGAMVGADLLAGRDQGSSENFPPMSVDSELIDAPRFNLFSRLFCDDLNLHLPVFFT